jgi:hypothetical protein
MYIGFHVKCKLFLSDFNETSIFWTDFRKIVYIKYRENPSLEAELQTDRRIGRQNKRDGAKSLSVTLGTRLETCRSVRIKHWKSTVLKTNLLCPQTVAPM